MNRMKLERERERGGRGGEGFVDKGTRLMMGPATFPVSLLISHFQQFYVSVMRRVVRIIGFFFPAENDPLAVGNGNNEERPLFPA